MTDDLMPCPFCGGSNIHVADGLPDREGEGWTAYCDQTDCLTYGPLCETRGNAIAAWNKRPAAASATEGWIACAERMPDDGIYVLTFGRCHNALLVASWDKDRAGWFTYEGPDCDCDRITHWRPLPAPPLAAASEGKTTT